MENILSGVSGLDVRKKRAIDFAIVVAPIQPRLVNMLRRALDHQRKQSLVLHTVQVKHRLKKWSFIYTFFCFICKVATTRSQKLSSKIIV